MDIESTLHKAMSKLDPNWMDIAMSGSDLKSIVKLQKLKCKAVKWVLDSNPNNKELKDQISKEKEFSFGNNHIQKSQITEAMKLAGNYKKKHIRIHGLEIAIENKKNSYREGIDPDGIQWKSKIYYDYGYIKGTKGADGDHVDVFIGPNKKSEIVFIVNQNNPKSGQFDEHKIMLGFISENEAKNGYLKNYEKNWKGFGSIVTLSLEQFKIWLEKGSQKKELKEPKIEFLKSDLRKIAKSVLVPERVLVHGKNGPYYSTRLVKKETDELDASRAFSLKAENYQKPKPKILKEKPKYKVRKGDEVVGNLITNIKNLLIDNKQESKAKEFTDLAYIAETTDDIYDIAKDYVELEGKASHKQTAENELALFRSRGARDMNQIGNAVRFAKAKSRLLEIVKGGRHREDGEEWTQPSGRKVKKVGGKIVPVGQGKRLPKGMRTNEDKKTGEFRTVIRDGFDLSKLKEGFAFEKNGQKYEFVSGPTKREDGKTEAIFRAIKTGEGVANVASSSIDQGAKGGFYETAKKTTELAKGSEPETAKEKGIEAPSSLPFRSIQRIKQYTEEKDFDKPQIESLKQRILENGFDPAFPIMVDKKDGKYTVVAGHHRHMAVEQLIQEGKLPESFQIPVVVKEFASDNDRLAAQVGENQRRDVLPTDESKAYSKMVENGWDAERIAEKLGKKVGEVNKRLALNNLDPDLFNLVKRKDKSFPLGVAEVIGMFCKDDSGNVSKQMQLRAFKWYTENRSKYPGRGPSVVQSYIKELQSGQLANMDWESVATDTQKEAMRTIGSTEKALANKKMLDGMIDSLMRSYQRILGDNINQLNPQTAKELAASLAVAGGSTGASPVLGKIDAVINDLSIIKNAISSKLREIESDAQTPMMFGFAKSTLAKTQSLIVLLNKIKTGKI